MTIKQTTTRRYAAHAGIVAALMSLLAFFLGVLTGGLLEWKRAEVHMEKIKASLQDDRCDGCCDCCGDDDDEYDYELTEIDHD